MIKYRLGKRGRGGGLTGRDQFLLIYVGLPKPIRELSNCSQVATTMDLLLLDTSLKFNSQTLRLFTLLHHLGLCCCQVFAWHELLLMGVR